MPTYSQPVVSVDDRLIPGLQQQQRPGDGFDRNSGVRTKWWWQAGPVDSCCFCCSLPAGAAWIAVDLLTSGIWVLFFSHAVYKAIFETALYGLQQKYKGQCEGSAASALDCEHLKDRIEDLQENLSGAIMLPTVIYVQGFLSIAGGVVGLWAVYFKSKRAAKLYMLYWPVKFVLVLWGSLEMNSLRMKYGIEGENVGFVHVLTFFFLLYYFKVSWSYYKRRLEYSHDAPLSSRIESGDTTYRGMPLLATNTNV